MLWAEPEAATATGRQTAAGHAELVLMAAALLILLTSYRTVVAGHRWMLTVALVVVVMTVAVTVLRFLGVGRFLGAAVGLLIELMLLGWIFGPLGQLDNLTAAAWSTIVEEQAPVVASRPVVMVVAAAFGALVLLFDLLVRANRATIGTTGVLLLCVYATPPFISGTSASPWIFVAVAALWLVIVRGRTAIGSATRRVRQAPAVIVAAAGLGAALIAPGVLPDIQAVATSWGHTPPQVFGRGINPMVELGANLRRNSSLTVLTYRTELTEPAYLKVATLTEFTGKTWRPNSDYSFARFETGLLFDSDIEVTQRETKIKIESLRSNLLPVPYPATSVEDVDGRVRWERTGQTIELADGVDSRGQNYIVQSLEVKPTADQLRALPDTVPHDIQPFVGVDIPRGSDAAYAEIKSTAQEITADEPTTYDKAKALQDYLRTSGGFQYSETAPVRDDYDGNGIDVLAGFLKVKAGYCVHFSSAMAVMARSVGIPSRIAVGYAPGDRGEFVDGDPVYTVRSENLHDWTEIWITGAGWVRFDPTTGIGQATSLEEEAADAPASADDTGSAPTDRANDPDRSALDDPTARDLTATDDQLGRSAVAALIVMAGFFALPLAVRQIRRRWRTRSNASVNAGWREVEDTARDFGLAVAPTQTARSFARRLVNSTGVDADALRRLLSLVESTRYGMGAVDSTACSDTLRVVRTIAGSAPRRDRWRAHLLPRSLVSRRTPLPDHEV